VKKSILIAIIIALFPFISTAKEIKGDTLSINGIKVILLNGTHQERGYAYGRLLAKEIYDVYNNYFIELGNGILKLLYEDLILNVLKSEANINQRFLIEAEAIVEGIYDSEFGNDFDNIWGRKFDAYDLIASNSIVEIFSNFGCSSLSSWGESTIGSSQLQGDLIITRHLDWEDHPTLYNNHLIAAHNPSEQDQQKWVSFGFPGLFGTLSSINESGVAAFLNMGNYNFFEGEENFELILLSIRNAIELKDYNGDGKSSTADVIESIYDNIQTGGFIVHTVGARKKLDSALVVECSGAKKAVRSIGEYSNLDGNNLLATNHFRKLAVPEFCSRYNFVQSLLKIDSKITPERSWNVMKQGAGITNNLQVIQFIPATMDIAIGFTDKFTYGWEQDPFVFNFFDLFSNTSVINRSNSVFLSLQVSPNPVSAITNFKYELSSDALVYIDIISTNGAILNSYELGFKNQGFHTESMDFSYMPNGMYFVKFRTSNQVISTKIAIIR